MESNLNRCYLVLFSLAICGTVMICRPNVISASSVQADSVHFCALFDYEQWLRDNPAPAGKLAAERNVGPPRTVRLFYFLPNDRPFRQEVVDSMKTVIKQIQTFYAEQMQTHGYGEMTFRFEADAQGDPLVHRVDGEHADDSYYDNTVGPVLREIRQAYDREQNVVFIVVDNNANTSIGLHGTRIGGGGGISGTPKRSGFVMIPAGFSFGTAVHELTHAFGMNWHDFRDRNYVLSYGSNYKRISDCTAGVLAVNPNFNWDIPFETSTGPMIEQVSPARYPAGSKSVSIRLKASDVDGVHQLILQAVTTGISATSGSWEVLACRHFSGEKEAIAEFEYDGVVPSSDFTSLSDPPSHYFRVIAIDTDGNDRKPYSEIHFGIAEDSPYLITTLEGRSSYVSSVAFSHDGSTLAAGSADSTVVLWDVRTREQIAVLEGHTARVWAVSFSPDGSILAAGSQDGTIMFWDMATREAIPPVERHSNYVTEVAFSPDGKTFAAVGLGDDTVKLLDVATREEIGTLQMPTDLVSSMAFSPDGKTLAATSDGAVLLWDTATLEEIATLQHAKPVNAVAFSPDGAILAASVPGESAVVLWDVATHSKITALAVNPWWANSLAFSPDGTTLASGTANGTAILYNIMSEELEQAFPHAAGGVTSVDFSPDGATLAASSTDGRVELWDTSEWLRPRPSRLAEISGNGQQGAPEAALTRPLVVEVRDQYGDPLPGVPVTFTVTAGGGTLGGKFTIERPKTDTSGRAGVFFTLGPNPGTNTVEVSLGGRPLATFNAQGVGTIGITREDDFRKWHLPNGAIARLGKGSLNGGQHGLDISKDGRYLAIATETGVWVQEIASGRVTALLPAPNASSVSFSPNGTTLASTGWSEIELWNIESGRRIGILDREPLYFPTAVFSPDGATLASGQNDGSVLLWDVSSRKEIAVLEGHTNRVRSLAYSPDGNSLATESDDRTVRLWDVQTKEEIALIEKHSGSVASVAFSPDGRILASGLWSGIVGMWDVATTEEIAMLKAGSGHVRLAFSPDGRTLTTGSWRQMDHWNVETLERVATQDVPRPGITSLTYSPDGAILVTASGNGTVTQRYLESGNAVRLPGFFSLSAMAMSPDGSIIAVGADGGAILQWDLATLTALPPLQPVGTYAAASSLAFSPGGDIIAASIPSDGGVGDILLLDVATHRVLTTLSSKQHIVRSMAFTPDAKTLAAGGWGDDRVKLWNVATGDQIASLEGHDNTVNGLAFSPAGNILASGSNDNTVKLWDVASWKEIVTLTGHSNAVTSLAFSPDGNTLASASLDRTVKLWDLSTRKVMASLGNGELVHSVSFLPDGTTLAAGTFGKITLWDMGTRKEIATLEGHASNVIALSSLPDGSRLVSGSQDATMLIWDMLPYITPPEPDSTLR